MKILSPRKYANEFKVGYQTVLDWCKKGKLNTMETDAGQFKIIVSDDTTDSENENLRKKYLIQIAENTKLISILIEKNEELLKKIEEI